MRSLPPLRLDSRRRPPTIPHDRSPARRRARAARAREPRPPAPRLRHHPRWRSRHPRSRSQPRPRHARRMAPAIPHPHHPPARSHRAARSPSRPAAPVHRDLPPHPSPVRRCCDTPPLSRTRPQRRHRNPLPIRPAPRPHRGRRRHARSRPPRAGDFRRESASDLRVSRCRPSGHRGLEAQHRSRSRPPFADASPHPPASDLGDPPPRRPPPASRTPLPALQRLRAHSGRLRTNPPPPPPSLTPSGDSRLAIPLQNTRRCRAGRCPAPSTPCPLLTTAALPFSSPLSRPPRNPPWTNASHRSKRAPGSTSRG